MPYSPVMRLLHRTGRMVVISTIGFALLAGGIVMLVTPGPGLLAVAAGLAVLSREFAWAARIRRWVSARYLSFRDRRRAARVAEHAPAPTALDDEPADAA